jgi:hypothetical protein
MDMQHGHAAWTCSMDMKIQHGHGHGHVHGHKMDIIRLCGQQTASFSETWADELFEGNKIKMKC